LHAKDLEAYRLPQKIWDKTGDFGAQETNERVKFTRNASFSRLGLSLVW
jgi:hypothetical protein